MYQKVDKLDDDQLVPVPLDLSKLSDVIKNNVIKKTVYDKLVKKNDIIDTDGFTKKTYYNSAINDIKGDIPSVTCLATNTALNRFKNKIPGISDLAKKTNYDAKTKDFESKYFTSSDYNTFTNSILEAKKENK